MVRRPALRSGTTGRRVLTFEILRRCSVTAFAMAKREVQVIEHSKSCLLWDDGISRSPGHWAGNRGTPMARS